MNTLKVKRIHPSATLPKYQTAGAACFDLHAVIPISVRTPLSRADIHPGESRDFRIGLAFEVPDGYVMKVYSRSGHGFKHGVRLANGTGIIDSDFRGELHVKLHNDSGDVFRVEHGDRVAQAMLELAPQWDLTLVDELSSTVRGSSGYGSTGK